jgi:hypothetical protein
MTCDGLIGVPSTTVTRDHQAVIRPTVNKLRCERAVLGRLQFADRGAELPDVTVTLIIFAMRRSASRWLLRGFRPV